MKFILDRCVAIFHFLSTEFLMTCRGDDYFVHYPPQYNWDVLIRCMITKRQTKLERHVLIS